MKKIKGSSCLLALLLLAGGCTDNPISHDVEDVASVEQIVLTEGIPAPQPTEEDRRFVPASDLNFHSAEVNGSSTTTLQLSPGQSASVKVVFRVTGRQGEDEWIRVNTSYSFDGTDWSESDPQDYLVDGPRSAGPNPTAAEDIEVNVLITHNGTQTSGSDEIAVNPSVVTGTGSYPAPVTPRLGIESGAELTVEFVAPTVTNRDPVITVVDDPLRVEAPAPPPVSVFSAVDGNVSASDPDDDPVTLSCKIGGVEVEASTTLALGTYTVECTADDGQGGSAQTSFQLIVEDTTPAFFTSFPAGTVDKVAQNIDGWSFDETAFGITVADVGGVSEPSMFSCSPADATVLEIGSTTTVSCKAKDALGNESTASTFDLFIGFDISGTGFLPPLREESPFSAHKRNSSIPHKFPAPRYEDGTPATDLADGLKLALTKTTPLGESFDTSVDADLSPGSTSWRYDADDEHYIFNAKTASTWNLGVWMTTASYKGAPIAETYFEMRK